MLNLFIKFKNRNGHFNIINKISDSHANKKLLSLSDFLLDNIKGIFIRTDISKVFGLSDNDVTNYIYEINSSPKEMKKFLDDFIKYFDKQRKLANRVIAFSTPIIIGIYILLKNFSEYINISHYLNVSSILFGLIMLIVVLFDFIYPMYVNDNLVLKIINNYLEDILIDESDYRRTKIGFR